MNHTKRLHITKDFTELDADELESVGGLLVGELHHISDGAEGPVQSFKASVTVDRAKGSARLEVEMTELVIEDATFEPAALDQPS